MGRATRKRQHAEVTMDSSLRVEKFSGEMQMVFTAASGLQRKLPGAVTIRFWEDPYSPVLEAAFRWNNRLLVSFRIGRCSDGPFLLLGSHGTGMSSGFSSLESDIKSLVAYMAGKKIRLILEAKEDRSAQKIFRAGFSDADLLLLTKLKSKSSS